MLLVLWVLLVHMHPSISLSFNKGYTQPQTKSGAYEIARDSSNQNIAMPCVILVTPFLDQNIGSGTGTFDDMMFQFFSVSVTFKYLSTTSIISILSFLVQYRGLC